MKQKVVIKVSMNEQKSRKKAMKTVVGHLGVESAALKGQDKNEIEVVGDGIDSVKLVNLLRKNVGYAELLSVSPVKDDDEKKGDQKDGEEKKELTPAIGSSYPYVYSYNYAPYPVYEVRDPGCEPSCTIM